MFGSVSWNELVAESTMNGPNNKPNKYLIFASIPPELLPYFALNLRVVRSGENDFTIPYGSNGSIHKHDYPFNKFFINNE